MKSVTFSNNSPMERHSKSNYGLWLGLWVFVLGISSGVSWGQLPSDPVSKLRWKASVGLLNNRVQVDAQESLLQDFLKEYTSRSDLENTVIRSGGGIQVGVSATKDIVNGSFVNIYGARYAWRTWRMVQQESYSNEFYQYDVDTRNLGRLHHHILELYTGFGWQASEALLVQANIGLGVPLADRFNHRYRIVRNINGERYDQARSRSYDRSFTNAILSIFFEPMVSYCLNDKWSAQVGWKLGGQRGNWYGTQLNATAWTAGIQFLF